MNDEYVIGFDCREMWLNGFKTRDAISKAQSLNPTTGKELRVDRKEWGSFFTNSSYRVNGQWASTPPGYSLEIPDVSVTSYGFWNDLEAMRAFIAAHRSELREPFWMIAITLVETSWAEKILQAASNLNDTFMPQRGQLHPAEVNPKWTLLGYDVQNDGPEFGEGLGDGYPEIIQIELREKWGKYLNKYFLFDDLESANRFALEKNATKYSGGPFFVYGIYRINEVGNALCSPDSGT